MANKRTYSLFTKENGKYIRLSSSAYHKDVAVRLWQSALLAGSMNGHSMYLRPAYKDDDHEQEYKDNYARVFKQ